MSTTKRSHHVSTTIMVVAVAAAAAAATAMFVLRARRTTEKLAEEQRNLRSEYELLSKPLRMELEDAIKNVAIIGSKMKLTNRDQLVLYGLYKQILYGDAPSTPRKFESWNIMKESAKYTSWCQYRGLSCELAAQQYISFVRYLESISDWEKTDNDEDDDDDHGGIGGSIAVSRPIDAMAVNEDINDHYDDMINGATSIGSQFFKAASENDVTTIRALLQQSKYHPDIVNHTDPTGQTALHIAADKGCFDVIQVLIKEYNANVHIVDENGISVLQTAVVAGHYPVCVWLLQNTDVNPDQPDHDGDTPRSCAEDDPKLLEYFRSIPIHS